MKTKTTERTSWNTVLQLHHCSLRSKGINGKLLLTIKWQNDRIRKSYKPCQRSHAIDLCNRQETAFNMGEGLLAEISGEKVHIHIGLQEAFEQWLENMLESGKNARHINNLTESTKSFLNWMVLKYPSIKSWQQLTKKHIQAYHKHLDNGERAFDTVRHRLSPIRSAASFISRETDSPNPYTAAHIVIKAPTKAKGKNLNSKQLLRFLQWLRGTSTALYDVAIITGLTGCRVLEATALRYCDIDLEEGTITITETDEHTTKTKSSRRTIPVCSMLLDHLRMKCEAHTGDPTQTLCKSATGLPLNLENTAYKNACRKMFIKARVEGVVPERFMFRELRACFITIATNEVNVQVINLEKYVGHKPQTMIGRYYNRPEISHLKSTVTDKIDGIFRHDLGTVNPTNIKVAWVHEGAVA